jgi:hypothetical protein
VYFWRPNTAAKKRKMNVKTAFSGLIYLWMLAGMDLIAQSTETGKFSGQFQTAVNFYEQDDSIGANTEVYLKAKSGADAWLFLNYEYRGFTFAARFDGFQNSPLLDPQGMYTKQGIGFWQIAKQTELIHITAGYFYEQFATGMLFRAYEDRNIGIDFAIKGIRLKANPIQNLRFTGFSGQQKGNIFSSERFGYAPQVISGANVEYDMRIHSDLTATIGGSAVNRVLDNNTMNRLITIINSYTASEQFLPKYNVYGFNGYGNLSWKGLSYYGEYNYKSPEAMFNQEGTRLFSSSGDIQYHSLSYSKGQMGANKQMSFGGNAQYKRIENFVFRTSPFENLLNGMIAYLPSITRQNTYRLLARYNSVVQELGEQAFQGDFIFTPKRGTSLFFNYSHVESLPENGIDGKPERLFNEWYVEVQHKFKKNKATGKQWVTKGGFQRIFYNQDRYEIKPGYDNVKAMTYFGEVTWKYHKTRSWRLEGQLMETRQDLGSFINVVLEWNIAPHWSFAVGDMVNHKPFRQKDSPVSDRIIHYYSTFVSYTKGPSQLTLSYLKQVEGVNCTGGICRVEPAFSGLRFTANTAF